MTSSHVRRLESYLATAWADLAEASPDQAANALERVERLQHMLRLIEAGEKETER